MIYGEMAFRALFAIIGYGRIKRNVKKYQERIFLDIMDNVSKYPFYKSKYANKNNYSKVRSIDTLKNFSVFSLDDLNEVVAGIKSKKKEYKKYFNEHNIIAFATSSGTGGTSKESITTVARINDIVKENIPWAWHSKNKFKLLLKGKTIFYPAIPFKKKGQIPEVNISGFQTIMLPDVIKRKMVIPDNVWKESDEKKRDWGIAYYTLSEKKVNQISFASAFVPYNRWKFILDNKEKLINELRKNGHKKRAKYLETLIRNDNFYVDTVFPDLFILRTIKGKVNEHGLKLYATFFKDFSAIQISECGVNSSEARGTFGLDGKGNPGLPSANINVYVFLELRKNGTFAKQRKLLHELENGRTYKMYVFTKDGPYLWDTEDLYEMTGKIKEMPILNHVGKNMYVNFAQEHAHINDIISAVYKSASEVNINVQPFFLRPYIKDGKTGYNFIIEVESISDKANKYKGSGGAGYYSKFAHTFLMNIEYRLRKILTLDEAIRDHKSFRESKIQFVKKDTVKNFNSALARSNGQTKHKYKHDELEFGTDFKIEYEVELNLDEFRKFSRAKERKI